MTTRNLLMALTVILLMAVFADRLFLGKASATEPALLLPPIVAAVPLQVGPVPTPSSDRRLRSITDAIRIEQRQDLEQHLALEFHRTVGDVVASQVVID